MTVTTFKSDEARNRWRDMMDIALTGGRVIVERYNKPQAILIGYEQMNAIVQRLQELEAWAEAQRINQNIESGKAQVVTFEQHKARMQAKGATYDLGDRVQSRS